MLATRLTALLLLLVVAPCVRAGTIYRCPGPDGVIAYWDRPCSKDAAQTPPQSAGSDAAPRHNASPAPTQSAPPPSRGAPLPGHNAPAPMHAPAAPVSSAQLAEAERLLQVINGDGNIAGGAGPSVEPTARTFVKQLDLQNPAWGPTHTQWGSMIALVKSDLELKVAPRMAQIRAAGERAFAQGMGERLTAAELARLAQFFSTASGQRYLSFEHALLPIDTDAQEAMSLGSQSAPPPARVSQAVFEQRVQVLSRSFSWQAGRSDSTAGGSPAEGSPLQMMGYRVAFTAQRQGPAIDRVARLYAHDFPSFDRFNESTLGKRFFTAWSAALKADAEATGADTLALDDYISHQFHDQWMQAYQERVQQSPQPGVLTATAPAGH